MSAKKETKSNTTFYKLSDFLEDNKTEFVLVKETKNKPAVIIKGYTKASREWNKAVSKYKVSDDIRITQDQEIVINSSIELGKKKALVSLITEITGFSENPMTSDTDEIKLFMLNPQARAIMVKWESHLNSLGNKLENDEDE